MNTSRRAVLAVIVAATLAGCTSAAPETSSAPAASANAASDPMAPHASLDPAPAAGDHAVSAPSVAEARTLALRWVASTGALLAMGPIGRSEFLREQVASASLASMTDNLDADLAKLADGLPIPTAQLRLLETPLTIDVSLDAASGQAQARVWSVVVFGAKDLGSPRVVFRTSVLTLGVEGGGWKLVSFTSTEGPTPLVTDALPSDWDAFAVVAGWSPASIGVA